MQAKITRRTFFGVTGAAALSTTLSACFGVGNNQPSTGGNNSTTISIWDIRTGSDQEAIRKLTNSFNSSHSDVRANIEFFQNDPYKQKLQIAMGAHNPPDIFIGWGGGILKNYVDADNVYDLTPDLNADSNWKNRFIPSILESATFDGKIYGVPCSGMQPLFFFYNKELFKKHNLKPPQTWDELLKIVDTLNKQSIIPIALAGASKWPYLMYLEYLADRIGGPDAFKAILNNQANSWSQDAVIKAATLIQQLINSNAFGSNFASVVADTNQDAALIYTGKAAMMLQGSWNFPTFQTNSPDFVKNDKLGWFPFPAVEGGKGDASNICGNPSNFYSISKASKAPQKCITYLKDAVLAPEGVKQFIALGNVPPVQGIESQLASSENGEWLQFNYQLVQKASHFQLSWDQALQPQPAQELLTNLDRLFLKQITPQQFADNMNKTLKAS
ncbi:raffinose/stachyose/melibiose transport system substrate-binding protein [Thermosporothrix hazakensis]|jgi:raffinose/stachyose/melibiose transport system substrate-binding protein|uniref:Raffinose/stachyose/melibiose transport system substrate-binding protein n=1 Tax=Thermosporothrix hazakensis TaxID=644383 RepID=A0A326U585_THEHA|nr:extracellular solute-binding protein [Thermosporothrix hazakensis]PZW28468.1 raffinose/stachyose/melibiose transport system substrate-binding protein [Thermosporothrix hazakensis]GCE45245.1 sugar ABC transporter substrate-binding protein [Thermosporothrix hazakensis]